MVNLFDVGTADATGSHSEENFAFANFRDRHRFHRHAALATVDAGAHMADGQVRIPLARRPG